MRLFGFLLILAALVGCSKREVPPAELTAETQAAPEDFKTSGLPRAREGHKSESANAKPQVIRRSVERTAPSSVLFPSDAEESAKWAEQRAEAFRIHQRKLDEYHVKKENALGISLPQVHVGE